MAMDLFSGPLPTLGSLIRQRVVVGIGNMAVSNNPNVTLSTYALGSCVGVVAFDPGSSTGGLIHIMLPSSREMGASANGKPYKYADTGMRGFFKQLKTLNINFPSLRLFLAGGAMVLNINTQSPIGDRNIVAVKKILQQYRFKLAGEDIGGRHNRTLHLNMSTGVLEIKTPFGTSDISMNNGTVS